jgi:recombination protein RecT
MSTTETLKKDLAKPKATPLQDLIQQSAKELGRALPSHLSADRLVRIALTNIRLNPGLAQCTPESFLGALFTLAQIGVEPVAGRAYLLPFINNRKVGNEWRKTLEVQAIIGYKGLVDLFYRHEKSVMLTWGVVKEGDDFDYRKGTGQFLHHKPGQKRGKVLGYWVAAKLQNGGEPFEYMSAEDCMAHGQAHSKTWDKNEGRFYPSSPWANEPEAMCLKTVLIQLAKLLPLSMEMQTAIANDETSREYRNGLGSVLDIPATTNWDDSPIDTTAETEESAPAEQEQTAPPAEASDERYISAKQRGLVFARFRATGKDETILRDYLTDSFGSDSTSKIPADNLDQVLKFIESCKA